MQVAKTSTATRWDFDQLLGDQALKELISADFAWREGREDKVR